MKVGDIVFFKQWHKHEWEAGRIESETQTGSFIVRLANGTICGVYKEDIYCQEDNKEEIPNNIKPMNSNEVSEFFSSKGFKITIAIIIIVVTYFFVRWPVTSFSVEQSPIDQKTQKISQKELTKANEYKIQKEARDKQREQKKIEDDSVARVKATNDEIVKINKELMELIK